MHSCSHVDVFTEETRIPILALAPVARSTAEIRRNFLASRWEEFPLCPRMLIERLSPVASAF